MPISWNEIRQNAIHFAREWLGEKRKSAEKQTFWNEFYQVDALVDNICGDYRFNEVTAARA